jgi:predicted ferric reductase
VGFLLGCPLEALALDRVDDLLVAALLLYVRIIKPLFMLRRPYRVTEVRPKRGDTWTLVMNPDGHRGFRFKPGRFGWLTMWGSPFKIAATRSHSRRAPRQRTGGLK